RHPPPLHPFPTRRSSDLSTSTCSSSVLTPGSTTAMKSDRLISLMRFIRASDNTIPPLTGTHPPTYPCPAPRGVTGIRWRLAKRRSEEHTSELQSRSDLVC